VPAALILKAMTLLENTLKPVTADEEEHAHTDPADKCGHGVFFRYFTQQIIRMSLAHHASSLDAQAAREAATATAAEAVVECT